MFWQLKKMKHPQFELMLFYGGIANLILFIFMVNHSVLDELSNVLVTESKYKITYWAHYLSIVPFVIQMSWLYPVAKKHKASVTAWVATTCLTILLSMEMLVQVKYFSLPPVLPLDPNSDIAYYFFENLTTTVIKSGFPILWGLLAFVLLSLGIKRGYKELRIAALSLIGLTVLKLFVYDIRNVSEGGKIAAFILLGLVLLVISFTYQKIKAIILEEKATDEE
jgi:hypothetical protein